MASYSSIFRSLICWTIEIGIEFLNHYHIYASFLKVGERFVKVSPLQLYFKLVEFGMIKFHIPF